MNARTLLLLAAILPARQANYDESKVPSYTLPDPLKSADGKPVGDAQAWRSARRPEILELFRTHVYGRSPGRPSDMRFSVKETDPKAMDGKATRKQVEIRIAHKGKEFSIHLLLFLPNGGKKPHPAFLLINHRAPDNIDPTRKVRRPFWPAEEVVARGYGIAAFQASDLDPDRHDGFKDGVHGVFDEGRTGESWGTLSAWAWGASRAMDYFETDSDVDASRVAVVGHSRGGKTALWAGAQDERFALVISNDSGCGGAALSRRRFGETVQRINKSFPHWFCGNFRRYDGKEDDLPVDQHLLIALVAPRAVYVASASKDLWADPKGEFLSVVHAEPAWKLLGRKGLGVREMPGIGQPVHGDGMAYHLREGKHDLMLYDWERYMDFADREFARKR